MKQIWKRCLALALVLALALAPMAQALTPEQLKEILGEYYLNEIPQEAMDGETVEEILDALGDPYTMYLTAQELEQFEASMEDGSIVGIGISGVATEDGLLIAGLYDGSPAEKLGLAVGDVIIQVDGKSTAGQTAQVISGWLKGEEGTQVSITVRHADGTERSYTAVRAQVVIPSTTTEYLEEGGTGYITCTTFGSTTQGYVTDGIQAYDDANVWVVDLRSNGGGDVYTVTQTLGAFLGEGTMVYMRDSNDRYYRYVSQQESLTSAPVIVLTSSHTASSAEIFALAMKDQAGALLIGSNTYGKGVAQVILTEEEEPEALTEGDALRITAYQYYGVSGNTAQTIGVIPDLLVDSSEAADIALLLSPTAPEGDNTNWLRVHLGGWMWYIDATQASSKENLACFASLLSALPPACRLYQGTGSSWKETTAAQTAKTYGVTDYSPRVFSDVEGTDCQQAANTLCTYGILQGYSDGTYRPNRTLTRAELCALLVQAMNLSLTTTETGFSDVDEDSWYAPYVQAVCDAGYLEGVGNGQFSPLTQVTHEQLITVLGRLAAKVNLYFYQSAQNVPQTTGVPESYSSWAKPWAWLLAKSQKNVLGQTLTMLYAPLEDISPRTYATRGETAQVLYTIFTATGILHY